MKPERQPRKHMQLKLLIFFGLLFAIIGVHPNHTEAHASLIKANPAPNSHLSHTPSVISLTFNERLEKELYYIKLFNAKGTSITKTEAVMSTDQHKLSLNLPKLKDGVYTVSYHVISADGHPVGASYPITVGKISQDQSPKSPASIGHDHGGMSFSVLRAIYYFALLTLMGFLFWSNILRRKKAQLPADFSFWFKSIAGLFLLMTLGVNYLELGQAIGDASWSNFMILLFKTTTGLAAISLTVLGIVSLFALRKWLWLDILWLLLVSITEAIHGHAAAFSPVIYTVFLDTIHLITAGIWTGGLVYIALYWTTNREHVWTFVPIFSKGALISFLALIITGSLSVIAFLPTLKDLFITTWGLLLLSKVVLVILVIIVAAFLRRYIKNNRPETFKKFHRIDILFLIGIIVIVGVMTYVSPLPENEPFHQVVTKNGFHTDITIQPKNPGTKNVFTVDVTTHQTPPQNVKMFLIYQGDKKLSPVEVPLKKEKQNTSMHHDAYYASGPFISIPGDYKIEVHIVDKEDNVYVINKRMTVYPVNTTN